MSSPLACAFFFFLMDVFLFYYLHLLFRLPPGQQESWPGVSQNLVYIFFNSYCLANSRVEVHCLWYTMLCKYGLFFSTFSFKPYFCTLCSTFSRRPLSCFLNSANILTSIMYTLTYSSASNIVSIALWKISVLNGRWCELYHPKSVKKCTLLALHLFDTLVIPQAWQTSAPATSLNISILVGIW